MKKLAYILLLLMFMTSCKTHVKPVDVIIGLKGVSEIEILLLRSTGDLEVRKVLTSGNDIEYFKNTFMPSKGTERSKTGLSKKEFQKDGEIRFFFEGGQEPFVVEYDLEKGYRIELYQETYYEQFTYRTGRYLVETLSTSSSIRL